MFLENKKMMQEQNLPSIEQQENERMKLKNVCKNPCLQFNLFHELAPRKDMNIT